MINPSGRGKDNKVNSKHLQRYVIEFSTHHNMREEDTIAMMEKTVSMMAGKCLTYADLIVDNGMESGARGSQFPFIRLI